MEKRFTPTQVDLALRKERLIQRVERGESLEAVSQDLGLAYHPKHISRLRRRYIDGGRHWMALVDGREGGQSTKITAEIAQWLVAELQAEPDMTAPALRDKLQRTFRLEVSDRRIRQLTRAIGRVGQPGRPRQVSPRVEPSPAPLLIEQTQHAGIFFPTGGVVADGDPAGPDTRVGAMQSTVSATPCGAGVAALDQSPTNQRE